MLACMSRSLQFAARHLLLIILVAIGLLVSRLDAVDTLGLRLLDWQRQLVADTRQIPEKIILVEVDQSSLDQMEAKQGIGWPWPRELYGGMASYIARGGAKATMIDILFNNETPYGVSSDDTFAELLAEAGNVFLASALTSSHDRSADLVTHPHNGKPPAVSVKTGLSPPLQKFVQNSAGLGAVNSEPDRDGIFRRLPPAYAIKSHSLPVLGLAPFLYQDNSPIHWRRDTAQLAGKVLPLDEEGQLWVNYPETGFVEAVSAYDLVYSYIAEQAGETPPVPLSFFKDAYVFIGYSAPGLYDLKPTPFNARAPGIEVHMSLLYSWLADDFLQPVAWFQNALVAVLFATLVYLLFAQATRVMPAIAGSVLLLLLLLAFSMLLVRLDYIPMLSTLFMPPVLVAVVIGAKRMLRESRDKEFRQKSLEKMVSPNVANWLLQDPDRRMQRTGEMRDISVFFSDLQGFTTLAESLGPQKTVRIINQYMDMMQSVILHYDGTIKQFVGDAVMAIWGAPQEQHNQAELAINTALESQKRLDAVAFEYDDGARMALHMRIGVDHGKCIVGNIGSSERFEYAAVGDTVNRASRLEGLNKFYGTRIIASETAWQASNGAFYGRRLDSVQVKGKQHAVSVYEPLCRSGEQTDQQRELVEDYQAGWQLYANGKWQQAAAILRRLQEKYNDGPSGVLLERIELILQDPAVAGNDWQGIWKFSTK